jgi:YegS/Rv2252/BmrU family lipid kinase
MKKILLVFNPKSGRKEFVRRLYEVINLFSRAKYVVTVYPTTAFGDANTIIKEQGKNYDLIVCSGGDGIINEAVNAYMHINNPPHLAYIPSGTTNDFAVSVGIPRDILKAARSILEGQVRKIDIGAFGDKYFSYVAAFGWFTKVTYTTDQNTKNIFGHAAYIFEGIKHFNNIPSIDCTIHIDNEIVEGNFALGIIANGSSVGGYQKIVNKNSAIDDGLLEVLIAQKPNNFQERQEIINTLLGTQKKSKLVIKRTAKKIKLLSQPCDWNIDGEFGGRFENIEIENLHHAVKIILPHGKK